MFISMHTSTFTHIYIYIYACTHTHACTHMWERGMFTYMQPRKDKFSVLSYKRVRMVSDGHHMAMSSMVSGL